MFKYILIAYTILPLIGLIFMENGSYGLNIGKEGYFNGSSLAYFYHLLVFFIAFVYFQRINFFSNRPKYTILQDIFNKRLNFLLFINLFFLFFFLFVLKGYEVWIGQVGKGSFRSSFGLSGVFAYWTIYVFIPSTLAWMFLVYNNIINPKKNIKYKIISITLIAMLTAATWGYKTTAIMILLPSISLIYFQAKFRHITLLVLFGFSIMLLSSMMFDADSHDGILSHLHFIFERSTIMTSDTAWLVWETHLNKHLNEFNLMHNLLSAFGNLFFSLTNYDGDFINYNLTAYLTNMAGYEDGGVGIGHNVTGTIFSEAIIIYGDFYLIHSAFSGAIGGFIYSIIKSSLKKNYVIITPIVTTYFLFYYLGWLMGGTIITLIHLASFIGIFLGTMLLIYLNRGVKEK